MKDVRVRKSEEDRNGLCEDLYVQIIISFDYRDDSKERR